MRQHRLGRLLVLWGQHPYSPHRQVREGIRFTNYTVESECTPTRSAILTGRQSVRSGTFKVPFPGEGESGLSPWEYTLAELLSDSGYATALYGKWHLGEVEGRLPTDQGFDEWWGYKNSVDEAGYSSYPAFRELIRAKGIESPKIWEGQKGQKSTAVRELDLKLRPFLDEMIVGKATDYINRAAKGDKPFFTYVALSNFHPPAKVHPDFDQTDPSRLGMYADTIAEMDHRLGQIVDCVDGAGIGENTIIAFSSDNGAAMINVEKGLGGSSGPFRGGFFTPPWEGSMRVPAMVRCPGTVRAGVVTEQMLSAHDWYKTFAALAGALDRVPTDRPWMASTRRRSCSARAKRPVERRSSSLAPTVRSCRRSGATSKSCSATPRALTSRSWSRSSR
jgi:arylsulfatase A-like enzyme